MSWNEKQIKYIRFTAVRSLFPDGQFEISAKGVVKFLDGNSVTEEQIVAEEKRILKEYEDSKYQRDRLKEYPDLQECIHAILDDDLTALQAKRKLIKDKYPKP